MCLKVKGDARNYTNSSRTRSGAKEFTEAIEYLNDSLSTVSLSTVVLNSRDQPKNIAIASKRNVLR